MQAFGKIVWVDLKLFSRNWVAAFFTLAFPVLNMFLFGAVYGNQPAQVFGGHGSVDVMIPGYIAAVVIGTTGFMNLPLELAACRQLGVLRRLRASPLHPWVVLATYDTDSDILRAVEAGATSYILKDAPREELFRAIRATAQEQSYLTPSVASRLMGQLRAAPGEQLSPREVDVLTWVARGASNKEIARHLHISEATVKSHLLHIFAKLEVNDRTQAVTQSVRKDIIHLE